MRKGEKGITLVYADRLIPYRERTRAAEAGDEPQAIPFLKRFTVFNADQCEGLPAEPASTPAPVPENLIRPQAAALIRATGADLRIGAAAPSTFRAKTTSGCRRPRRSSSRSTFTGRFFMNVVRRLWLCIAGVWPMAKPQSRSFSAQNENISGFAIWYPLLVCCFRLADIAGCRLSAMSDVERPKPELYREAAERLRQLAGEIRLPDIRADLLDLSASPRSK